MTSRLERRCLNIIFSSSRKFGSSKKQVAPRSRGYFYYARLRPPYKPHSIPLWGFCPAISWTARLETKCLRPAYKPHFVRRRNVGLRSEEFLPDALPGRSSLCAAYPELERREQRLVPAWPCSRRGLPGRPHCCRRRWSLTPPFHHDRLAAAVCFCGPIRQVTSPRGFPGAVLCGVRTFLDSAPKRGTATVQPT